MCSDTSDYVSSKVDFRKIKVYVDGSQRPGEDVARWAYLDLSDGGTVRYYSSGIVQGKRVSSTDGELMAATKALIYAISKGVRAIEICYDYDGIFKLATGRSKPSSLTSKLYISIYNDAIREGLQVTFTKVDKHDKMNRIADSLARGDLYAFDALLNVPTDDMEEMVFKV
ncbi:reverse transcriptase-like protein [Pseudothermotoga sp. U03pept]|uniref:reverse transcriptase-like protein n=1 Tax=Pseudothermotoga sp. U03pept TaxID=3447012 RepID=UPI003EFF89B9